ncbi:cytochrome o ubiquinol oxidase subunit III [Paenibacillus sp. CCS19]|uniref:cytochrome o ubiquinol oxidase subunit III n=1 Tax=Paenibacillus sp. CCS19 TaxID=3158387 RepID=UPI0025624F20|nr:cytochrome o ubiquinol oxidase subunit III [Paenibacillus cellulosilyticus]GMK41794.1 cytochrome o ubiquinol oxidase subunit III [Paenibacillus cellulosilyticus]
MAKSVTHHHNGEHAHEHVHHDLDSLKSFGFWIFLMTDVIIFGCLFAVYVVLRNNTAGGPTADELFKMPGVIAETFILLTSSFTSGLAVLAMHAGKRNQLIGWLAVTFLLGASFIYLEVAEFIDMVHEGATIATSGFLSGFFTLVGTHGLHVSIGLVWMIGLMLQLRKRGITKVTKRKVEVLSLYWHFLDVVWIFVLTVVYLMGVM